MVDPSDEMALTAGRRVVSRRWTRVNMKAGRAVRMLQDESAMHTQRERDQSDGQDCCNAGRYGFQADVEFHGIPSRLAQRL